jgi:diaminohydroxyphosphoribosylaminopyrimidine deaminase/5-amino-6-(5-phosphoribosylamino)uracil reductase
MPERHARFMRLALHEAQRGWGTTHPNPMVGAVITDGETVVASGFHARAGEPHAEINALRALDRPVTPTMVLYVTLEPCSTHGRTGACTDAILRAGIKTVVVGAVDPNPDHAGRGLTLLRKKGLTVVEGVLKEECDDLNLIFNHLMRTGRPFVAIKAATTLDGKIATRTGDAKWISGPESRSDVMRWRQLFPAIAAGAGTVLADNPALTSRRADGITSPVRIILDREGTTLDHGELQVFSDNFREITRVVVKADPTPAMIRRAAALGVTLWPLGDDPEALCQKLFQEGIYGLMLEGGSGVWKRFLARRAADYLIHYQAPLLLADAGAVAAFVGRQPDTLSGALQLKSLQTLTCGDDIMRRGFIHYPEQTAP